MCFTVFCSKLDVNSESESGLCVATCCASGSGFLLVPRTIDGHKVRPNGLPLLVVVLGGTMVARPVCRLIQYPENGIRFGLSDTQDGEYIDLKI